MSRNDYTTTNLLDYLYYQSYYNLTGIDFSRQTDTNIPHQINFTEKLEEEDATIFYCWKAGKNYPKLFFGFIDCNKII